MIVCAKIDEKTHKIINRLGQMFNKKAFLRSKLQ